MNIKEKPSTNANTLSVKLLKTIGSNVPVGGDKKIIKNLTDLNNRLKGANKEHE